MPTSSKPDRGASTNSPTSRSTGTRPQMIGPSAAPSHSRTSTIERRSTMPLTRAPRRRRWRIPRRRAAPRRSAAPGRRVCRRQVQIRARPMRIAAVARRARLQRAVVEHGLDQDEAAVTTRASGLVAGDHRLPGEVAAAACVNVLEGCASLVAGSRIAVERGVLVLHALGHQRTEIHQAAQARDRRRQRAEQRLRGEQLIDALLQTCRSRNKSPFRAKKSRRRAAGPN